MLTLITIFIFRWVKLIHPIHFLTIFEPIDMESGQLSNSFQDIWPKPRFMLQFTACCKHLYGNICFAHLLYKNHSYNTSHFCFFIGGWMRGGEQSARDISSTKPRWGLSGRTVRSHAVCFLWWSVLFWMWRNNRTLVLCVLLKKSMLVLYDPNN